MNLLAQLEAAGRQAQAIQAAQLAEFNRRYRRRAPEITPIQADALAVLVREARPCSGPEVRAALPQHPVKSLYNALAALVAAGTVTRSGADRHYRYSLARKEIA